MVDGPGKGKWSQAGVPHRGWICVNVEDLGAPDTMCEMCERQEIRYVHYMTHPNYPGELACGCICAGYMEEDHEGAKRREAGLRSAARRRRAWPDLVAWKLTEKGNWTIRKYGYRVTVFRKAEKWSAVVNHAVTGYKRFALKLYDSLYAAKLAAFDALTFHRNQISRN